MTTDGSGHSPSISLRLASEISSYLSVSQQDSAYFCANVGCTSDWDQVLACAQFHGLTSILAAAVLSSGPEAISLEVLKKLSDSRRDAIALDLFLRGELVRLLQLFKQESIRVLPLKGPVLAQFLYSDSSLRPSSDLDILVHSQDMACVVRLLNSSGFTMEPYVARVPLSKLLHLKSEVLLRNQQGLMVDLHWAITPNDYPFRIDPAVLWNSARDVEFGEVEVPVLGPEVLLVFLCIHGTKHAWSRLIWLADVARLIQTDLNWEEVFAQATQVGCERPLLLGLLLAGELLGAAIPSAYVERARTQRLIVSMAEQVKRRLSCDIFVEPTGLELTIFNTRLAKRWWDKVRHFTALLKAPTEAELEWLSLPPRLFVLYYPLRFYRLMTKYGLRLIHRARPLGLEPAPCTMKRPIDR